MTTNDAARDEAEDIAQEQAFLLRVLNTLTAVERDYVAIGLEHAFGATLVGDERIGWLLVFIEGDRRIGLDGETVTVGDVWNVAKAAAN